MTVGEWNRLLNCGRFPIPSFVQFCSCLIPLHPQYPPDLLEGDCGGVALEGGVQEVIVVADQLDDVVYSIVVVSHVVVFYADSP